MFFKSKGAAKSLTGAGAKESNMKKIMTLAVAACAILGSNAASVSWSSATTGGSRTFLVDASGAQMSSADFASLGVSIVLVSLSGADLDAYKAGSYSAAYDASAVLSTGSISTSSKAAIKGSFTTKLEFTYGDANPISDGDWLAVQKRQETVPSQNSSLSLLLLHRC